MGITDTGISRRKFMQGSMAVAAGVLVAMANAKCRGKRNVCG